MEKYNYHFEIQTLLTQFAAAFNDVKIKRFDGKKFEKEIIKIPLVYAPKSHIISDVVGVTDSIRLPIMAVEILSQTRDNNRIKNKIDDLIYENPDGSFTNLKAIPWNLQLNFSILAKYQEDIDQIIQNFSVQNNPYAVISWREPKSGREIRSEVFWDGNISFEYPGKNQKPNDFPFRVTASTNFTLKGWLFQSTIDNSKSICKINTDYTFTDRFFCNFNELTAYTTECQTDSYTITGRPIVRYAVPSYITNNETSKIIIQGLWLQNTVGIFVSGSNPEMYPLTEYKPFSGVASFYGYKIDKYNLLPSTITFTLPPPKTNGFIDIIAVNSCGIGSLVSDSSEYVTYSGGIISTIFNQTEYPTVTCV